MKKISLRIDLFILLFIGLNSSAPASPILSDGREVTCDIDAFNCPSTRTHKGKALKNCSDLQLVWDTCKGDPHGLDRNKDGRPCQRDCPNIKRHPE